MPRSVSAPGKLFLAGEYAVLWGGTARVMGVGPRGWASAQSRSDGRVTLLLQEGRLHGAVEGPGITWEEAVEPAFHFVARAVEWAVRAHGAGERGFDLALSPSLRAASGTKLGLGTSARATVLAVEATRQVLGADFDTLKVALCAHSSAQAGKGSGGDVAACATGGVLRYRRFPLGAAPREPAPFTRWLREGPPVDVDVLPAPVLPLLYASAGESASTPQMIARVESAVTEAERQRFVTESDGLGHPFESALLEGDLPRLREVCRSLSALLRTLGPVETPALGSLMREAERLGAAAKVSGAGGGDGCLLFCETASHAERVALALRAGGATVLAIASEPGLQEGPAAPTLLGEWLSSVDR